MIPKEKMTLPALELLEVFMAIKCLKTLLKVHAKLKIDEIIISVDAQIVLSWLMTDPCKIKTKNLFAKNRLKDILLMSQDIKNQYGLDIQFKYIPTKENPADMLTRGLTREGFGCDLEK